MYHSSYGPVFFFHSRLGVRLISFVVAVDCGLWIVDWRHAQQSQLDNNEFERGSVESQTLDKEGIAM